MPAKATRRRAKTPPETTLTVYLEAGRKRVFACAVEWPGWCRSGRSEEEALNALLAYGERYARAVASTGLAVPVPETVEQLKIIDRIEGGPTTDFGAPGSPPAADERPLDTNELDRLSRLLSSAWQAFDRASSGAADATLRTGPRGGGRDLAKMVDHVREADAAYLVKLGSRRPAATDPATQMERIRSVAIEALAARATGSPLADPAKTRILWPPRYYVRRSAWHALDHAWEIDDRT